MIVNYVDAFQVRIQQPMFIGGKYNELTDRDMWQIFANSIDPCRGQAITPPLTPDEMFKAQQTTDFSTSGSGSNQGASPLFDPRGKHNGNEVYYE